MSLSFYLKLALIFLALVTMLAVGQTLIGVRTFRMYEDEVEQKLQRDLAARLSTRFQPALRDSIDDARLAAAIQDVTGLNPRLEIFLLGADGEVKAAYTGSTPRRDVRGMVDVAPLEAFLAGAPLPLYGTHPRDPTERVPFSVAYVSIMGMEGCYLYVLLEGMEYRSLASMIAGSYLMRSGLVAGLLLVGFTLVAGFFVFSLLTRRLRRVQAAMERFERGDHAVRAPVASRDEVGMLAEGFNRLADALVAQMERLRQDDQLRRDLVANVSHDLRSPLASIRGYLETLLLKGEGLTPDERRQHTETLLRNTERLGRLVDNLFELSRLDAWQVAPQTEAFSLAELVQDVVVGFVPLAQSRGVHLSVEPARRLTPVRGDLALVERAVTNLVDNAVRYTPAGGAVRVRTLSTGDIVRLAVEDSGVGIPPEDLPRIFDRFYRVEKSRAPGEGGTGLGLAITQRIVELHGSRLEVESTPGAGTTFAFALPVA